MKIMKRLTAAILAAALSASALYLSVSAVSADSAYDAAAKAESRRKAILNSKTEIVKADKYVPGVSYSGKAYYVSNNGDDNNDGLSPQTAWATVKKANDSMCDPIFNKNNIIKPGDAVFFERGGIWRESLRVKTDNITVSAYGKGEKPRFYGSPFDAAGEENWKLWYDKNGKKIWKLKKQITDCGGIVFDGGKSYASRVYQYYDGKNFLSLDGSGRKLDPRTDLKYDLQFIHVCDLKGKKPPVEAYNTDTTGDIYLRCDKGNPGKLYKEIEFQAVRTDDQGYVGLVSGMWEKSEGSNTFDNLCVMYVPCVGIQVSGDDGSVIQNCEVAWAGGSIHIYGKEFYPAGEGIRADCKNGVVKNCYTYQCFDSGIVIEVDNFTKYRGNYLIDNVHMENNLITECMSGIIIYNNNRAEQALGKAYIDGNIICNIGYGWSGDEHYDAVWPDKYYDGMGISFGGVQLNSECLNNGIYIRNNIIAGCKATIYLAALSKDEEPVFSGNTYIQPKGGRVACCGMSDYAIDDHFWDKEYTADSEKSFNDIVKNIMKDKTGKVIMSEFPIDGKLPAPKLTGTKSGNSVTLKWSEISGAYGYRIYELDSSTNKYKQIASVKGTRKTIEGLSEGTHNYRVIPVAKYKGKQINGNPSDTLKVTV